MAPQRPDSKHRTSRPTSGPPSPTKSSPRKSTDKRQSRDVDKRESHHSDKRRSRANTGPEDRDDKRDSRQSDKRRSHASNGEERDRRRSAHGSPTKGSPRKGSPKKSSDRSNRIEVIEYEDSTNGSSNALSMDSLAKLNAQNAKDAEKDRKQREKEKKEKEKVVTGRVVKERNKHKHRRQDEENNEKPRKRVVSGGALEANRGKRGGFLPKDRKKKRICLFGTAFIVLFLIIIIPIGVLVIGKNNNGGGGGDSGDNPNRDNLNGINPSDIPMSAKGSVLDPFTWYDTEDFNVTYTDATVGGLPVMGLMSKWDDSTRANKYVPPLNEKFKYGEMPIRGVNVGGWLNLEPFITPSFFKSQNPNLGIVDEWTLTKHLGPSEAAKTLEKHYSTFINKATFAAIQDAGFDHVRIPFGYWALQTYPGDPYVPKISWRYLLRGIEYCRQHGLRINLDLHGLPGSQNGWNHSGRQGSIGWINGTDGDLNAQRSLDIHDQLSQFFSQPRYKNIVGVYGLANEPKMISLPTAKVLEWTTKAVNIARKNGIEAAIAFGDGFMGLTKWQGQFSGLQNMVLDAHQYVIFNIDQLGFDHKTKLNFACQGWAGQMRQSINTASG